MKEHSFNTATITTIGMFTAVLAVLSILQIPMPSGVPITLQTFAVALCGYVLGRKNGTLCVLLYLLLGFAGVPAKLKSPRFERGQTETIQHEILSAGTVPQKIGKGYRYPVSGHLTKLDNSSGITHQICLAMVGCCN